MHENAEGLAGAAAMCVLGHEMLGAGDHAQEQENDRAGGAHDLAKEEIVEIEQDIPAAEEEVNGMDQVATCTTAVKASSTDQSQAEMINAACESIEAAAESGLNSSNAGGEAVCRVASLMGSWWWPLLLQTKSQPFKPSEWHCSMQQQQQHCLAQWCSRSICSSLSMQAAQCMRPGPGLVWHQLCHTAAISRSMQP